MKADFSRSTFDPARHFKRVPLQQGRAQTDADANEQQAIVVHRVETEAADLIGGCGAPIHAAGFGLTVAGDDLMIGAGRFYAGGTLVENEAEVSYVEQPDYPLDSATLAALGLPAPLAEPEDGEYLVYLDVWEWHRTALEVPAIREVALGGPDTATRTQVVGQVKLHALDEGEDADCVGPIPSWTEATAPSTGQLGARADVAAASSDPCIVEPGAGYRRLENQLYRVEVHEGGARNDATYKWDRDNGTVVARLGAQSPDQTEWTVSSVGRDAVLRFAPGDWAELTDDAHELHGLPGTLVQVVAVEGDVLTVDLATRLPAAGSVSLADFLMTPRVRRWNGVLDSVTNQNFTDLEDGVQIRLRAGTGDDGLPRRYHTGDYWTIPARTNTGDVEWPTENDGWTLAEGITHHYCRLARVEVADGWGDPTDCRPLFPPVTELTSLFYVGGDGQEGGPQTPLGHRLQVGVANGAHPVESARVQFEVSAGGGRVNGLGAVEVATDAAGLASAVWTLGPADAQRVEATLLNAAGEPLHLPVRFGAEIEPRELDYVGGDGQHSGAGDTLPHPLQVGVSRHGEPVAGARVRFRVTDGGGTVGGGPEATVVTQADGTAAVDWTLGPDGMQRVTAVLLGSGGTPAHLPVRFAAQLGGPGEQDPGFHVEDMAWMSPDGDTRPFRNDAEIGLVHLMGEFRVQFDAPLSPEAVVGGPAAGSDFPLAKPVCLLTLHLPYPLSDSERRVWNWDNGPGFGTRPIRLDGRLDTEDDTLIWTPSDEVRRWLSNDPFNVFQEREVADRILGTLTLKGDMIWARTDGPERVYLDGEAFGIPRGTDGGTDIRLPSGDLRRGSDLEAWFWLVRQVDPPSEGPIIVAQPALLDFGFVPIGAARLRTAVVINQGDEGLDVQASVQGTGYSLTSAASFSVPPGRSQPVTVRFASGGPGTSSGVLRLLSNATNNQDLGVPLRVNSGFPGPPTGPTGLRARVQFINDLGPLALTLGGERVPPVGGTGRDFPRRAATPFRDQEPGELIVALRSPAGDAVLEEAISVEAGRDYVLVATTDPETGRPTLLVTEGEPTARDDDDDRVEAIVVNAAEDATPARVDAIAGRTGGGRATTALADGLPRGRRTEAQALEARSTTLRMRVGDASRSVRLDLRALGGEAVTLVLTGTPDPDDRTSVGLLAFTSRGEPIALS